MTDVDLHFPELGLWRLPQVLAHIPVSKSTFYARIAAGEYPAPVKLGRRISAWRKADIKALLESTQGATKLLPPRE